MNWALRIDQPKLSPSEEMNGLDVMKMYILYNIISKKDVHSIGNNVRLQNINNSMILVNNLVGIKLEKKMKHQKKFIQSRSKKIQ